MTYELADFFCGAGGSSQGAVAVPGVSARFAANHWDIAIASHEANFPEAEHFQGDIHEDDAILKFPRGDIFWASPECPKWSQARGKRRDFDKQPDMFGETLPDAATDRSRALMWDVPKYLEKMILRGHPVLAGVVENVVDVRDWTEWRRWVGDIEKLGYRSRLIALNSMHARPRVTPLAPQSRDRLYLAYWATSLGRDPDWNRWLRPSAWCPSCEETVQAVQWWKRPGNDMGRYRSQYLYRCPRVSCRGRLVEPGAMPAAAAIDWAIPGTRVGDRETELKPKTIARIEAGLRRYARPITLEAAGNTYEKPGSGYIRAWPVDKPITTQTTTITKGVACPPMMVPAGGTWREDATSVEDPMATRTTRENDGLACPPFLTIHRGGEGDIRTAEPGEPLASVVASGNHFGLAVPPFLVPMRSGRNRSMPATDPLATIVADGSNHALVMRNNSSAGDPGYLSTPASEPLRALTAAGHQSLITWEQAGHMLVPYYGTGTPRSVAEPVGTVPTKDRWSLASVELDVNDVLFRMLEPHEIGAAMAFIPGYHIVGTSKRVKVRQYGNAVTPPVAEVIISALVEVLDGQELAA